MSTSDRPLFIVGCPRSGTTLLRTMLHAHPRIAVPPETRFLTQAYNQRSDFGDLTDPRNRERLARWITDRKESRFHVLGLDADSVVAEVVAGPPTLGSALGIVFRAYSRRHGKQRWGDKRPAYYAFVDELDHLFPDAQFIHLVRDGRACVASLKQKPWYGSDSIACMSTWTMAVDSSRESGARLGPSRYYELRYEDLASDPERQMRALCAFLGEDFAPQMCEPEKIAEQVNPAYYEQQAQIARGIYTDSFDRWREQLEPWEVATFEQVAAERLARYGYEPSGIGGPAPPDAVRRLVRQHRRLRRQLARRRRADGRRLVDADRPVAALLTAEQVAAAAVPIRRPLTSAVRRRVRPLARRVRRAVRSRRAGRSG